MLRVVEVGARIKGDDNPQFVKGGKAALKLF